MIINNESKFEEIFDILTKEILELNCKITRLETMINLLVKGSLNDYNDYNISNDIIMENVIDRSINFSEPPLTRQNAFNRS